MLFQEAGKKQVDYVKMAADAQQAYKKELAKFGIKGEHIKRELVELATELSSKFEKLAKEATTLEAPINYYDAFREFVELDESGVSVPLLRTLAFKGRDLTVYEWKRGKEPKEIQRPAFELEACEQVHFWFPSNVIRILRKWTTTR